LNIKDGGSLDVVLNVGRVPEEMIGKITVAVSTPSRGRGVREKREMLFMAHSMCVYMGASFCSFKGSPRAEVSQRLPQDRAQR
jgi:hypothetical protein